LNLSNNRIGVEGGKAIARSLFDADGNPSRSALRRLNLSCNSIGDDGAKAFGETLLYNNTLDTLDLSDNKIGIDGIVALLEGLKDNYAYHMLGFEVNLEKMYS
jgi:Ran GTPase-activating protein (RanGAP) involved in mRNA processing and transport